MIHTYQGDITFTDINYVEHRINGDMFGYNTNTHVYVELNIPHDTDIWDDVSITNYLGIMTTDRYNKVSHKVFTKEIKHYGN